MATPSNPGMPALVVLALGLAEPGCKSECDEGGLRRAAAAFATRSLEQRQAGFQALGQACSTLPPALGWSLLADFDVPPADQRAVIYADRPADPVWRELFQRTCPRSPEERDQALAAEDRSRAMRTSCKLDRYELLAPDDVFILRDFSVFMLYEWLSLARVDRALARDVVWPLLSASASGEELEAMCLNDGQACEPVVAGWGLELPRSSIDAPIRGGPRILVTPTRLSVERVAILSLHAGLPATDAFVRHVSPALQEVLAAHAEQGRIDARAVDREWDARVTFMADRATPLGTLADTFFTVVKAGFTEAELVVFDGRELRALSVSPPRAWLPPDPDRRRFARSLELTFTVHRDSVEARGREVGAKAFPNRQACEPPPSGCHDLEAITAFAKQTKLLAPHETVAVFRVDRDVTLQALVSLVDAVRGGEECRLLRPLMDEELPAECLFFQAIVDAEPPLHFRIDRVGTFTLGSARISRSQHHASGGPSDEAILAAYAAARDELRRCLVERAELLTMLDDEDHVTVIYGRSADDRRRTTARVFLGGFVDDEPERCVLTALGAEPDRRVQSVDFLAEMQADLVIPTRFEAAAAAP